LCCPMQVPLELHSPDAPFYTVEGLKRQFSSLKKAKEHFGISAQGWEKLCDKLNAQAKGEPGSKTELIKQMSEVYGWAGTDVRLALEAVNFADSDAVMKAMLHFAGKELQNRQRLQASQKALVTRLKNDSDSAKDKYLSDIQNANDAISKLQTTVTLWRSMVFDILNTDLGKLPIKLTDMRQMLLEIKDAS
jgi:chitinase